ncbi:hypothetical protein JAAARDRAFT_261653 [Jaapia argillacea MUCL 33604]|uniref:Uncharacterized protein n=1 Tax=Jaapia argillacea MUCL 33604 TaxID=933084 RepID=A0A067Q438_9AGAM|nr:hypothetical protein JAAARDRAFT_261653 [Jaapia argillacea MUCL 33604]
MPYDRSGRAGKRRRAEFVPQDNEPDSNSSQSGGVEFKRKRAKVMRIEESDEEGTAENSDALQKTVVQTGARLSQRSSVDSATGVLCYPPSAQSGLYPIQLANSPRVLVEDPAEHPRRDSTPSEDGNEEAVVADPGGFLIKWGVNEHHWVCHQGPDWVWWTLYEANYAYRRPEEFKRDARAYLDYLDKHPEATITSFGKKHKGMQLDQCHDLPYIEWCCKQDWSESYFPIWRRLALQWLVVRDRRIENAKRDVGQRLTGADDIQAFERDVVNIGEDINGIHAEMQGFILPDGEGEEEVEEPGDDVLDDEASAKETSSESESDVD